MMSRCVFVLFALSGIFAAPHHETIVRTTIPDCFGSACGDHKSACKVSEAHGHVSTHCEEPSKCFHSCTGTTHLGHDGCCCYDQACVDSFRSGQSSTNAGSTVRCQICHDIRNADCTHYSICHGDELCLLHFVDHRVESYCAPKHECEGGHHGHHHEHTKTVCCGNDTCVQNAISLQTQAPVTTPQPATTAPPATDMPTTAPPAGNVMSSTAGQMLPDLCPNVDTSGYCEDNASTICQSIDYQTHLNAVKNCAKTCNFCIEYLAMQSHSQTTQATGSSVQLNFTDGSVVIVQ